MKNFKKLTLFFVAVLCCLTIKATAYGSSSEINEITVYAAASLVGPLDTINAEFEKKTKIKVKTNYASSGSLSKQMENGGSFDVFFSASKAWMDYCVEKTLVDKETVKGLAGNDLVFISPKTSGKTVIDNIKFGKDYPLSEKISGKIVMGDPSHAPVGKYAKQSLESLGWWEPFQSRLIFAKDARQVLYTVETGDVELGIAYYSDAVNSDKIYISKPFPEDTHKPIRYFIALNALPAEKNASKKNAEKYFKFLFGKYAQQILKDSGLKILK